MSKVTGKSLRRALEAAGRHAGSCPQFAGLLAALEPCAAPLQLGLQRAESRAARCAAPPLLAPLIRLALTPAPLPCRRGAARGHRRCVQGARMPSARLSPSSLAGGGAARSCSLRRRSSAPEGPWKGAQAAAAASVADRRRAAAWLLVLPAGVLGGAKEKQRKFMETVELQIGLKNYDPQKDKRFSGSVKLPYCPRPNMKVRRRCRWCRGCCRCCCRGCLAGPQLCRSSAAWRPCPQPQAWPAGGVPGSRCRPPRAHCAPVTVNPNHTPAGVRAG